MPGTESRTPFYILGRYDQGEYRARQTIPSPPSVVLHFRTLLLLAAFFRLRGHTPEIANPQFPVDSFPVLPVISLLPGDFP